MIHLFVPDADLPEDIQQWFDPAQSLPKNVRLVSPPQRSGMGSALLALFAGAIGLLEAFSSLNQSGINLILGVGIAVAALGTSLWFVLSYREAKTRLKDIAAGRHRYGCFVHPRFLLLRQDAWVLLLPWENIISHTTRAVHSGESWGQRWELKYIDENGKLLVTEVGLAAELEDLRSIRNELQRA